MREIIITWFLQLCDAVYMQCQHVFLFCYSSTALYLLLDAVGNGINEVITHSLEPKSHYITSHPTTSQLSNLDYKVSDSLMIVLPSHSTDNPVYKRFLKTISNLSAGFIQVLLQRDRMDCLYNAVPLISLGFKSSFQSMQGVFITQITVIPAHEHKRELSNCLKPM